MLTAIAWELQVGMTDAMRPERIVALPANGDDGFDILLHVVDGTLLADFGGLTEEFQDAPQAMKWVRRALSCDYQLTTKLYKNQPYEFCLEPVDTFASGPETLAAGNLLMFRSFRRAALFGSVTLQNRIFAAAAN